MTSYIIPIQSPVLKVFNDNTNQNPLGYNLPYRGTGQSGINEWVRSNKTARAGPLQTLVYLPQQRNLVSSVQGVRQSHPNTAQSMKASITSHPLCKAFLHHYTQSLERNFWLPTTISILPFFLSNKPPKF